jgi:hypothetical protein
VTARRATPAASLKSDDFELATRLGPHGVTFKSLDQLVKAPKVDRNGWDPVADRKAVNPYDRIVSSLRAAALRRDAAAAGAAPAPASQTATTDAPAQNPYVAAAIQAYVSNSSLTPAATTATQADSPATSTPTESGTTGSTTATPPADSGSTPTGTTATPPADSGSTTTGSGTSGTTTTAATTTSTNGNGKATGKGKNSGTLGVIGL